MNDQDRVGGASAQRHNSLPTASALRFSADLDAGAAPSTFIWSSGVPHHMSASHPNKTNA